jgi:hypothetical protein
MATWVTWPSTRFSTRRRPRRKQWDKDFISPVDNTNTLLAKTAHLLMYDAVTSGPNNCANLGLSQLNQENNAKAASFDTPNPPKTLKQAIAQIVFDTYATQRHEALSPNDIDVRFELSPHGPAEPIPQRPRQGPNHHEQRTKSSSKALPHIRRAASVTRRRRANTMGTRQPREYQTHPQGPAQTPCACGCHTGWAPVNAPYGASQRARPHDAAKPHQPAMAQHDDLVTASPYDAANQLLARCLRCLSWPTSAPMPLITPELRSRGLFP